MTWAHIQITTRQSAQSSSAADAKQSSSSAVSALGTPAYITRHRRSWARLTRFIDRFRFTHWMKPINTGLNGPEKHRVIGMVPPCGEAGTAARILKVGGYTRLGRIVMDDAKHLERARLRIINLEQERDELRMMVERLVTVAEDAQPIVCSMLHKCP